MIPQCTFEEAVETVRAADKGKWDLLVPYDQLAMSDGAIRLKQNAPSSRPDVLDPNEWATGQLCSQLGIPAAYFKRCPDELKDRQFNHWLSQAIVQAKGGEPMWLLRAQDTTLRAALSPRYSRLDNATLIANLERHVDESLVVQSVSVTDVSFHIRLLKPRSKHLVRVGDEICAGIHIANSEVGMRAVTVDALVYRLVCTNGMIRTLRGESLYRRRHIGIAKEDLVTALPDAIGRSIAEAEQGLERFAATVAESVHDPESAVKALTQQHQLSEEFARRMTRLLEGELASVQNTRYGLINALTGAARSEAPDERYRIEALAGSLVEA